jgi:hypothetical protein
MPDAPDRAELEAAIYSHLGLQPAGETTEAVIVKVAELEPVTWPPDSKQLRAGLFLSVPFLEATARSSIKLWPVFARASSATRSCRAGTSSCLRRRFTPTGTRTRAGCF